MSHASPRPADRRHQTGRRGWCRKCAAHLLHRSNRLPMNVRGSSSAERDTNRPQAHAAGRFLSDPTICRRMSGVHRAPRATRTPPKLMQRDDFCLILPVADECPEFIERRARHEPPPKFLRAGSEPAAHVGHLTNPLSTASLAGRATGMRQRGCRRARCIRTLSRGDGAGVLRYSSGADDGRQIARQCTLSPARRDRNPYPDREFSTIRETAGVRPRCPCRKTPFPKGR